MKRIYLDIPLAGTHQALLPAPAFHYIVRVLRCRDGERLAVFNGDGNDYHATLSLLGKKSAQLDIERAEVNDRESPLHTTLIQGLSKGERMDIVMQKAVELGVNRIIPVRSEFCAVKLSGERLEKKMQHWRGIIVSACEQSGRARLPELLPLQDLPTALASVEAEQKWLLHPYPQADVQAAVLAADQSPASVVVLVGPEGGFSDAEVEQAVAQHYHPQTLGRRILRTETAALVALSLCQYQWGDWRV
ncbi:MAG: 16S rRNA (uracil(1498)-N(3))-methyltransferase [Gammaproteobacteria bacterium]|nr:MAG: 16S rRNA (uracil(1498)-N(3))-methyltransferase [Gammaproteobacteria bacterium]